MAGKKPKAQRCQDPLGHARSRGIQAFTSGEDPDARRSESVWVLDLTRPRKHRRSEGRYCAFALERRIGSKLPWRLRLTHSLGRRVCSKVLTGARPSFLAESAHHVGYE